jgi:hypothetical protein
MSLRADILKALLARAGAISKSNGFDTDAGLVVFMGETPQLGPDDPGEALAIVVGDEVPKYQGVNFYIELPIQVQAVVRADLEQPWMTVENIIGAIKKAVELEDRTLGHLVARQFTRSSVRALPREPGSTTVGAAVTYTFPFTEAWGNP